MKITLTGNPYSTNNIYFSTTRLGFRVMNTKAKERKKQYQEEALVQWRQGIIKEPMEIAIKLFFGDKRQRDWDNYHKLSMDALTGIVWEDDSQIKKATVEVGYDKENPRIELDLKAQLKELQP